MEKESQEDNNQFISGDFMAKRKRGRPRKHLRVDTNEEGLGSLPGFSKNQQRQKEDDDALVGQPVSGVIEATFEAGFLLSVKIGNSDSMLRGVVFKPGRCDPVSADNDVAPNVPMIRRNNLHHGSVKVRKSRFREKHGVKRSRSLIPVPIQPAIPKNLLVPVVLQPANLQNGSVGVTNLSPNAPQTAVPISHAPPLDGHHHLPSQTETDSQVASSIAQIGGGGNDKPFETLLTQVMQKGQVNPTETSIEADSEEQALSIEPLQAIHPVHPVHMPKPIPSYGGRGKMTELLQAVQENVRETHYSQGQ